MFSTLSKSWELLPGASLEPRLFAFGMTTTPTDSPSIEWGPWGKISTVPSLMLGETAKPQLFVGIRFGALAGEAKHILHIGMASDPWTDWKVGAEVVEIHC